MDESLLKAVSQHMNVPETLISRSASARAEANGSSTDDVLRAWLGGEAVQVLETKPTIPEEEPTKVAVETILEKKTEQVEEGALVEVLEKPYIKEESQILTQELVPPVGLIIKLYKSLKIGFIFGLSCGLTQAFIIGNTFFFGVYLDPDNTIVISEYSKIQFVLTISLTTALFSILPFMSHKAVSNPAMARKIYDPGNLCSLSKIKFPIPSKSCHDFPNTQGATCL